MKEAISIPQYKGSIVRSQRSLSLSKRPARPHKEAAPIIWNGSYADGMAMFESWERLLKSTSSALSQKKEHLPLVGQTLLNHQLWRASNNFCSLNSIAKIKHISELAKYSDLFVNECNIG